MKFNPSTAQELLKELAEERHMNYAGSYIYNAIEEIDKVAMANKKALEFLRTLKNDVPYDLEGLDDLINMLEEFEDA